MSKEIKHRVFKFENDNKKKPNTSGGNFCPICSTTDPNNFNPDDEGNVSCFCDNCGGGGGMPPLRFSTTTEPYNG